MQRRRDEGKDSGHNEGYSGWWEVQRTGKKNGRDAKERKIETKGRESNGKKEDIKKEGGPVNLKLGRLAVRQANQEPRNDVHTLTYSLPVLQLYLLHKLLVELIRVPEEEIRDDAGPQ